MQNLFIERFFFSTWNINKFSGEYSWTHASRHSWTWPHVNLQAISPKKDYLSFLVNSHTKSRFYSINTWLVFNITEFWLVHKYLPEYNRLAVNIMAFRGLIGCFILFLKRLVMNTCRNTRGCDAHTGLFFLISRR